jgi:hypothetical protein
LLKFHSDCVAAAAVGLAPPEAQTRSSAPLRARLGPGAGFAIPPQWHALGKRAAIFSPGGRRLGETAIEGKTFLDGGALEKRFGTGVLLLEPITGRP